MFVLLELRAKKTGRAAQRIDLDQGVETIPVA
jgi:hypothetical protein